MNIRIKTIPHSEHRYPTVGDWWFDEAGDLEIRVSDMGNWKYEALVAFHELAEVLLCKSRGITQQQVDEFDRAYEALRQPGDDSEPGDDANAPYRREHFFAMVLEQLLADQLDVNFQEYEAAIEALDADREGGRVALHNDEL